MFKVDKDYSISLTRGDKIYLQVKAKRNGEQYTFTRGDVVRFCVSERKDVASVVLTENVTIGDDTTAVKIIIDGDKTRLGEPINKPKVYWYEVVLNPDTSPCTIIGYGEDGPKTLTLYPDILD